LPTTTSGGCSAPEAWASREPVCLDRRRVRPSTQVRCRRRGASPPVGSAGVEEGGLIAAADGWGSFLDARRGRWRRSRGIVARRLLGPVSSGGRRLVGPVRSAGRRWWVWLLDDGELEWSGGVGWWAVAGLVGGDEFAFAVGL